ncbi:collagen triple helix repeat-containing protein, partial [Colletotrichum incanum]
LNLSVLNNFSFAMTKEAVLPGYGSVPRGPVPCGSARRTILISVITCVLILLLISYSKALSTINLGIVVCKSQLHGHKYSEPTNTLLEESSETMASPLHEFELPSNLGKQDSFFLRRRNDGSPQVGTAASTDGRSGYNRREEDGRSGYNIVEDGRSGYNSVTDGRSGYNRAI